jgi:hypothetical protein
MDGLGELRGGEAGGKVYFNAAPATTTEDKGDILCTAKEFRQD